VSWTIGEKMETKLYVGNLPYTTTEDELREMFAQAGSVSEVVLIKDRNTGRSKGFAFITMNTQVEIETAIQMFNDKDFEGRALKVNIARPREERRDHRGGGRGSRRGGSSRRDKRDYRRDKRS
jgi:RNA recognition motif-containing protein